jgi:hypothetical protein
MCSKEWLQKYSIVSRYAWYDAFSVLKEGFLVIAILHERKGER